MTSIPATLVPIALERGAPVAYTHRGKRYSAILLGEEDRSNEPDPERRALQIDGGPVGVEWLDALSLDLAHPLGRYLLARALGMRWALPAADLGELPDDLAQHSGAILACSAVRVGAGLKPIRTLLLPWEDRGETWVRRSASDNEARVFVGTVARMGTGYGWDIFGEYTPAGPETGPAGRDAADRAAFAAGYALLDDGAIRLPYPDATEPR